MISSDTAISGDKIRSGSKSFPRCRIEPHLSGEVFRFSKETGQTLFSEQDLLRRFYLNVFQYDPDKVDGALLRHILGRIAEKLFLLRSEMPFRLAERTGEVNLHRTKFKIVDGDVARILHEKYHYLGSNRGDGLHLGLYMDGPGGETLISLATLSPFDLTHLTDALPEGVDPGQVMVLSRLFVFDGSPRNTATFTLGRMFSWVKDQFPLTRLLLTYLNCNVGFVGSVYEASNWTLFGLERKQRYLYFDGDYITDRHMIDRYGTAKFENLRAALGDRISRSTVPIEPLKIYAYFLDKSLKKNRSIYPVYDFSPNLRLV